jgi:hypothetical protein
MTVIYSLTKINYTYEIPLLLLVTLRGSIDDHHKHHISNGLYLLPVLDAIKMPYQIVSEPKNIPMISRCYRYTRTYSLSMVVLLAATCCAGGIDEMPGMLPRLGATSQRRNSDHFRRQFRAGLVAGHARLGGDFLS